MFLSFYRIRRTTVGNSSEVVDMFVENVSATTHIDKDVLYGALWCAGGIIATVADIGFIFWGAIVFGGYQLIKGLANQAKYKSTSSSKIKDTEVLDSVS